MNEKIISNLIIKAKSNDEEAMEELLQVFKPKVIAISREYFLIGAEFDDLIQEGMIGLYKAINGFDEDKEVSFKVFADLCIRRQIMTAVKASTRQKHMPLNSYISLSEPLYDDDSERALMDMLAGRESTDPEAMFLRREKAEMMSADIEKKLSNLEKTVLSLYISGMNYQEIAVELKRQPKSIDNALQRIKRKLENSDK